jgi:hypothetical protein
MKLPEYALSRSDRVSTREELFEVLELLGGFKEAEETELDQSSELLACLEAEPTISPAEILGQIEAGEERFLMEIESFGSLLGAKAERIN